MGEWTPGPWTVDGPSDNQIVWSGPDERVCFLAHSDGRDESRDIATGRLIAAAPDLAGAIERALMPMHDAAIFLGASDDEAERDAGAALWTAYENARSALTRATGG